VYLTRNLTCVYFRVITSHFNIRAVFSIGTSHIPSSECHCNLAAIFVLPELYFRSFCAHEKNVVALYLDLQICSTDHNSRAVYGLNCLRTLKHWDRGFEESWKFVCVYSVFVLSCVQVAVLRRADPISKEFTGCVKNKKLKKRPRPNKGL
jgi:hypothetical protein